MKVFHYYFTFFLVAICGTVLGSSSQKEPTLNYNKETQIQEKPSGFYLGADVGVNLVFNVHSIRQYSTQAGTGVNYRGKTSFVYAFNAGYQVKNYRAEVVGSLLNSRVEYRDLITHLQDWTVLARGLYDFDINLSGFAPYLGVQLGVYAANPQNNVPNLGIKAPLPKGAAFSYGPIFGIRYNLLQKLCMHVEWNSVSSLDINKTILNNNYTYRVTAQTFLFGLKYRF